MILKIIFLIGLFTSPSIINAYNWDSVDHILKKAIEDRVTPGLSALVGNKDVYYI